MWNKALRWTTCTRGFGVVLLSVGLVACGPVDVGRDASQLPGVGVVEEDTLPDTGATVPAAVTTAPEVLQLSGFADWNGNRTIPGLWVAHPRVKKPIDARVVDGESGRHVDVRLFRAEARDRGDAITLSSDAAKALGLVAGRRTKLSIVALVPGDLAVRRDRKSAETMARSALTGFAATLDHDRLAQLVGALMRGMGYRTEFTDGIVATDGGSGIEATPSAGPVVRVAVRAGGKAAFSGTEFGLFGREVRGNGVGLVVSVPGFAPDIRQGGLAGGAFVQAVDLAGLLDLWVDRYQDMTADDRALLPLKPVYFMAAN